MQAAEATRAATRPPVQARSQRTRERLLEAAIQALVEFGYAGAKTNGIAARAEVSQGALYKHFPTKLDLLEAALAHVLSESRDRFARAIRADAEAESDPAGAVFRHLWDVFASPELQAAFELYLAARTDRDLAARVVPIVEQHRANVIAGARARFPDAAREHENFDGAVNALVSTMQGAAIAGALLSEDSAFVETQRRSIERMIRTEFRPRRTT